MQAGRQTDRCKNTHRLHTREQWLLASRQILLSGFWLHTQSRIRCQQPGVRERQQPYQSSSPCKANKSKARRVICSSACSLHTFEKHTILIGMHRYLLHRLLHTFPKLESNLITRQKERMIRTAAMDLQVSQKMINLPYQNYRFSSRILLNSSSKHIAVS